MFRPFAETSTTKESEFCNRCDSSARMENLDICCFIYIDFTGFASMRNFAQYSNNISCHTKRIISDSQQHKQQKYTNCIRKVQRTANIVTEWSLHISIFCYIGFFRGNWCSKKVVFTIHRHKNVVCRCLCKTSNL